MKNLDQDKSREYIKETFDESQYIMAVERCKLHLNLFPDDDYIWLEYGRALLILYRYEDAIDAIEKSIQILDDSDVCLAYGIMGDLYQKRGMYEEASFWYEKAAESSPEDATFWIELGVNHMRHGNFEQAILNLTRGSRCKIGCIDEAYYNLSMVKVCQGLYQEALTYLEKSLEISPDYDIAKRKMNEIQRCIELHQ